MGDDGIKVLIISGCPGAPHRYRCENKKEQLESRGHQVTVKDFYDLDVHEYLMGNDLVILYRVPFNYFLLRMVVSCRQREVPVVFDVDDMVFQPSLTPYASALHQMTLSDIDLYLEGVRRYAKTLEHVDGALVSTEFLQHHMTEIVAETHVIHNSLSSELIRISDQALGTKRGPAEKGNVFIGYLSGSPTHDYDLYDISYPLSYLMAKHKFVRLKLVGDICIPGPLRQFNSRIELIPFTDWRKLPGITAGLDINLAPLEIDNPHCQAKSAIKFMEAALVGTPTIATATEAFKNVIRQGTTGYISSDGNEWIQYLELLTESSEKRAEIGRNARTDVIARYNPDVAGKQLESVLLDLIRYYSQNARKKFFPGEKAISRLRFNQVRQVSDRSFWLRTKIRNFRFNPGGKSRISMGNIVMGELREMRRIGQEFLDPGSVLSGFQFMVHTASRQDPGMIRPRLMVNDQPVELDGCVVQTISGTKSGTWLEISFRPITIPSLSKVHIELSTRKPLAHTGFSFFCDPFCRGLKYRRYHNGYPVNGKLIFKTVTKKFKRN